MDAAAKRAVLLRLGRYLWQYKYSLLAGFLLMLASNLLGILGPRLSGRAINAIKPGIGAVDLDTVGRYSLYMILCYAGSALLALLLAALLVTLGRRISYSLRRDVFSKLMTLPVSYFDTHPTGDIISRISYDVDTVNTSLSHDLLQICSSVVTVAGCLYMMVMISPLLLTVFAVTVPISLTLTKKRTTKVRPLFRLRSAKLGELNGYAEEMLSGQRTIRAYGRQAAISSSFEKRNADACAAYYNADYHGATIGPSVNFINNLSQALIILFGGIFYLFSLTGSIGAASILFIELGDLSSFMQYSRRFSAPINEFANIIADLQSALSAAERIFRILDEPPEPADPEGAAELSPVRGSVDIENVGFGYLPGRQIIKDLTVHASPGKTVAIVGPTGAGKTTIINLLMRFYDVDSGRISIDGKDISSLTRASVRSAFTMVLQDTWLFGGTVAENIAYGREGATREQIEAVASAAKIDAFIRSLPRGYDTVVTDDGISISKGQKQLITIARAMLADSPMLILDEATSNVDSMTERRIQDAMLRLMSGRTCFVIAHRLSTVMNADVILVVRDGRVTERGTHAELMASGGFYAMLYNSQFDGAVSGQ
ncbi:MAG: ABC transporter ATP-binding protein [Clostridia bacterium]|nr:ABC transporter ATP-binding protein [Clostridia bacterium]